MTGGRWGGCGAAVLLALLTADAAAARISHPEYALANRCTVLVSEAAGDHVTRDADGYRASAPTRARATRFFMKPTGLGTYLQMWQRAVGR